MDIISAVNLLVNLTASATNLLTQAGQISGLIQKAQAEGRTTFNADEWSIITSADDASRKLLADAIVKALGAKAA